MQSMQSNGTFPQARTAEIPEGYTAAVLRVLPCNPVQLFVYWELPHTADRCVGISLSLTGPDSSRHDNPRPLLEHAVSPGEKSCYLTVPVPGMTCLLRLDATYQSGKHRILESDGSISLPPPVHAPGTPLPSPPPGTPEASVPEKAPDRNGSTVHPEQSKSAAAAGRYSSWILQGPLT